MIKSKQVWAEEHTDVGGEKNFEYKHLCISLQAGMAHSDYLAFLINLELFIFIWPPPPKKKKNYGQLPLWTRLPALHPGTAQSLHGTEPHHSSLWASQEVSFWNFVHVFGTNRDSSLPLANPRR